MKLLKTKTVWALGILMVPCKLGWSAPPNTEDYLNTERALTSVVPKLKLLNIKECLPEGVVEEPLPFGFKVTVRYDLPETMGCGCCDDFEKKPYVNRLDWTLNNRNYQEIVTDLKLDLSVLSQNGETPGTVAGLEHFRNLRRLVVRGLRFGNSRNGRNMLENPISPRLIKKNIASFSNALDSLDLEHLELNAAQLTDSSFEIIASAIAKQKNLRFLKLSGKMSLKSVELMEKLIDYLPNLEDLNLCFALEYGFNRELLNPLASKINLIIY